MSEELTPAGEAYKALRLSTRVIKKEQEFSRQMRETLADLTGHGPDPHAGYGVYKCICGYIGRGYPSDCQSILAAHVNREWEKACNDPA